MIDIQGPRCETCRFWFAEGDNNWCRRFPAIPVFVPGQDRNKPHIGQIKACFPTMLPSGWCGEYQK